MMWRPLVDAPSGWATGSMQDLTYCLSSRRSAMPARGQTVPKRSYTHNNISINICHLTTSMTAEVRYAHVQQIYLGPYCVVLTISIESGQQTVYLQSRRHRHQRFKGIVMYNPSVSTPPRAYIIVSAPTAPANSAICSRLSHAVFKNHRPVRSKYCNTSLMLL